ncbi:MULTISPECIES: hypothetical protein [Streptomyces]|uniref:Secreted protein n=1 Tax=Streptomyces viridochromogenes TaxID=1938 RepID=A0A0L8JJG9_STRVR|nr:MULTISPECIES: hypothetical protein [Streptomyces]KOG13822.1 hypothetical protein ADK34_30165 [Streptomyces viridochromogenes]
MHTATRPALLLTAVLALGPALGLAVPQTAAAHGDNLEVVITGHREGHVLTEVTWENDGDAVDEPVAALVSAVSADGSRTAGPWKLVRGTRPTDWTTTEALPAGIWKVTVAAGQPALGHAERQLTVAAVTPAAVGPSTVDPSTGASSTRASSTGGPSASGGTTATPAHTSTGAQETSPAPDAPRSLSASRSAAEDQDDQTRGPGPTVVGLVVASLVGAAAGIWIRRRRDGRR